MTGFDALCAELAALAKRTHRYCEDSWYSCPKAEDGCADDSQGDTCNCGADAHNAKVDTLLAALLAQRQGAAMTTPNRPPLWEVLEQATGTVANWDTAIRALRDWLVPEEPEPTGMRPCGDTYSAQSIKRGDRQRLRALLTAEADRAELGEVEA